MRHYLAMVNDQDLLASQVGEAVRWLKMVKPDIVIKEMPKVDGSFRL